MARNHLFVDHSNRIKLDRLLRWICVAELTVRRGLALGNLIPEISKACAAEEIYGNAITLLAPAAEGQPCKRLKTWLLGRQHQCGIFRERGRARIALVLKRAMNEMRKGCKFNDRQFGSGVRRMPINDECDVPERGVVTASKRDNKSPE